MSGPITKGNRSWNFYQAAEAQRMLLDAGYAVLNPMLSMAHMDGHNISWETWIASDLAFIEVCDLIVRLPGESKGADLEVAHAIERGIPVFNATIENLPFALDFISTSLAKMDAAGCVPVGAIHVG